MERTRALPHGRAGLTAGDAHRHRVIAVTRASMSMLISSLATLMTLPVEVATGTGSASHSGPGLGSAFHPEHSLTSSSTHTDGKWAPTREDKGDSGVLRVHPSSLPFHCTSNWDCQLNGRCAPSGRCECDPWWTGERCQRLALLPAQPDAGLQDPVLSSWGGSVLHNASDGTWHM